MVFLVVHLGRNRAIEASRILLLADMTFPLARDTEMLIEKLRKSGRVQQLGADPKTLVFFADAHNELQCVLTTTGLRSLRGRLKSSGIPDDAIAWKRQADKM
ncbi:MAG: hypothetical protein IJL88_15995 [Clostridia bacterium]|nr:hypothetical protein [Clostridia bacterium]